jgi:hypothetical protein
MRFQIDRKFFKIKSFDSLFRYMQFNIPILQWWSTFVEPWYTLTISLDQNRSWHSQKSFSGLLVSRGTRVGHHCSIGWPMKILWCKASPLQASPLHLRKTVIPKLYKFHIPKFISSTTRHFMLRSSFKNLLDQNFRLEENQFHIKNLEHFSASKLFFAISSFCIFNFRSFKKMEDCRSNRKKEMFISHYSSSFEDTEQYMKKNF